MARSAVTVTTPVINAGTAITKDAFDIANDHSIDVSSVKNERLRIFIENSDTNAAVFTIKSGDYSSSSLGDLSITTAAVGLQVLDVETARFKDSDGLILIDIASVAGATGNIYAIG